MFSLNEDQENYPPRKYGMFCPSRDFTSDEDSRDSGVADMDCENLPTTFELASNTTEMKVLDVEMDELVLKETKLSKKERKALNIITNRPRAFTDITNSPRVVESPKSRSSGGFARPFLRTQSQYSRKRTVADLGNDRKRSRAEIIEEETELVASCSVAGPVVPRPIVSMQRTHSTSVLERGSYAHCGEELPKCVETSYHLPTLSRVDSQAFRRINADTLCQLMNSMDQISFNEKYVLVDCRYPYEYQGGHIKNAINIYDPEHCATIFFPQNGALISRIPIFYCEYSQKRGPSMAYALRGMDRKRNELQYPRVDYQEIYVLDKGYRNFYQTHSTTVHRSLCEPCHYIPMDELRFACELKKFNFHKKSSVGATTCAKPSGPRSRLMFRQMSADSPSARPSARRLFTHHESAPFFAAPETPERAALTPIPAPHFS